VAGAAFAQTRQVVKIGAIYPLTGSASFLGIPEERALKMKVDEINKAGGINGKTIEVTVYDPEGNTNKAAQQLRRLAESDKVDIIFGPSSSGESLATIGLSNELQIPQIAHGGTEQIIKPTTKWVFNSLAVDRVALSHVLSYFKKKGIKTIALMTSADGYGQSGVLQSLLPGTEFKIATAEEFNRTDADMTAGSACHDAVLILEAALKKIKGSVTRDNLRDAIETVDVIGSNGHFHFSPTDHGGLDSASQPLVMLRWVKGKWLIAD
jgi:ABC-type branched-subunit amino acid transport system substrate-binding protein